MACQLTFRRFFAFAGAGAALAASAIGIWWRLARTQSADWSYESSVDVHDSPVDPEGIDMNASDHSGTFTINLHRHIEFN